MRFALKLLTVIFRFVFSTWKRFAFTQRSSIYYQTVAICFVVSTCTSLETSRSTVANVHRLICTAYLCTVSDSFTSVVTFALPCRPKNFNYYVPYYLPFKGAHWHVQWQERERERSISLFTVKSRLLRIARNVAYGVLTNYILIVYEKYISTTIDACRCANNRNLETFLCIILRNDTDIGIFRFFCRDAFVWRFWIAESKSDQNFPFWKF